MQFSLHPETPDEFWQQVFHMDEMARFVQQNEGQFGFNVIVRHNNQQKTYENLVIKPLSTIKS